MVVTGLNALTLIASLVVYPFIAARFEAGATDAFFLAMTVPWLIIAPAITAVGSSLIPVIAECRHKTPETIGRLIGSTISYGATISALAGLCLGALAPWGLGAIRSALPADVVERVAANIFALLPLVVLQTVTAVLDAASNSAGCFWLPAAAMLVRQVATLGAVAALQSVFGDLSLAAGFTAGGVVHLLFLIAFWRSTSTPIDLGWRPPKQLRATVRLAVPILASSVALQLVVVFSRVVAAGLAPGSVTALDYAYRVSNAVIEVSSSGILLIVLSDWSATVAGGTPETLRAKFRNVMPMVLFTLLPIVMVLHSLRLPVVTLWLGRSGIADDFVQLTAAILGFLLLGVPVDIASRVYGRALLAWQRASALAWFAAARLLVTGALLLVITPSLRAPGIALADVAGIVVALSGVALVARRYLGGPIRGLSLAVARIVGAAAGGWLTAASLLPAVAGLAALPQIAIVGLAAVGVYAAMAWLLGVDELRAIRAFLDTWRSARAKVDA